MNERRDLRRVAAAIDPYAFRPGSKATVARRKAYIVAQRVLDTLTNKEHCSRLALLVRDMYIDTPLGRVPTQPQSVAAFNYFVKHADKILEELQL